MNLNPEIEKREQDQEIYSYDVSSTDFAVRVVEESHRQLVVVDFWAPWCAPCRALKPTLERLSQDYQGAFRLAKVNTQDYPELAERFGVRGIPDVKFFKEGRVVAEFAGVRPVEDIERLLKKFVANPLQDLLDQARQANDPLPILEPMADRFAGHSEFLLAYARALASGAKYEQAEQILQKISRVDIHYDDAQRFVKLMRFTRNVKELRGHLGGEQKDTAYELAGEHYLRGDAQAAVETLLQILREKNDPGYRDIKDIIVILIHEIQDRKIANSLERRLSMLLHR